MKSKTEWERRPRQRRTDEFTDCTILGVELFDSLTPAQQMAVEGYVEEHLIIPCDMSYRDDLLAVVERN